MSSASKSIAASSMAALFLFGISGAASAPMEAHLPANSFVSFTTERTKVSSYLACAKPRINQASGELGALYSCIGGTAETVKFFVNEMPKSGGRVKNVKFLWNDYTKNIGYGVHADASLAKQWAGHLAEMYAPNHKLKVVNAFLGKKNTVIESETHVLSFTFRSGPSADERMYIVVKK